MKTTGSYRDAAEILWGEAGAYAHDAYTRLQARHYPELPATLPIVIGLTAYGRCLGLTRPSWEHGPRISIFSSVFKQGTRAVDDLLTHEMLHAWLHLQGADTAHDSPAWYEAVAELSPAVLGHDLAARRGAGRKSVRVPNPAWKPGSDEPRTLVRKTASPGGVRHADVARWPQAFRPADYDWGMPVPCPSY